MCGLLGESGIELLNEVDFENLLDLSNKRGPDHQRTFKIEGQIQLGFNRLSIQDLSEHAHQPYHTPNQLFDFVFNGEIYNCDALISKFNLDKTKFRSTSDTEVIAHLLEKITIETLANELNGMFAIAIYDRNKKAVSLLRDFAGIKPLFYATHSEGMVFASQFNQIYKHKAIQKELSVNPEALKEYLALGYMQAPNTIYNSIYQVEPGTVLKYSLHDHQITKEDIVKYTDRAKNTATETDKLMVDTADNILMDIVERQLISDVPIGTFLSGGIDSPIITALASKVKKELASFTVKVQDEKINESEIAKEYARHLGVENRVAECSNLDIVNIIDEHFKAYPEPFGDYSSLPTYQICKLASKKFKVMLSGDGGDELFWGYPRFYNTLNHANWFTLPRFTRKVVAYFQRKSGKEISYGIDSSSIGEWVLGQQSHNKLKVVDTFFKSTTSITKELKALYHYTGTSKSIELMQWLRWNEFYGHMQRVLIKVDRASMGNSLEVRVPLLDKESIEFAFSIAPDLNNENPKYVLKKLMQRYFPESLINKKKMGFTIDIETILKKHCKDDFYRLLKSDKIVGKDILNMQSIEEYVDAYFSDVHNNSWGIWIIYSYLKWSDMHH